MAFNKEYVNLESLGSYCLWNNLDDQVRNKVSEVAQDVGRRSHGRVTLTNGTVCEHWRAGNYRIFGEFRDNKFNFIGWGTHTGNRNNQYNVTLCSGGTTRAQTV